jgi:hypothetical protein
VRHAKLSWPTFLTRSVVAKQCEWLQSKIGLEAVRRNQDLARLTKGLPDTIGKPLLRFKRGGITPKRSSWLELMQHHCLANQSTTLRVLMQHHCLANQSTTLRMMCQTMNDLTRLCGSTSGHRSDSRSPALAFIVLCSVVKERCDHE